MKAPKHYRSCEICGAPGHSGKNCGLYRLNEKQESLYGNKRVVAASTTSTKSQ